MNTCICWCMHVAGPFDLLQYKAACAKPRAEYNSRVYNNPLFGLDKCGKYANPSGEFSLYVEFSLSIFFSMPALVWRCVFVCDSGVS